MNLREAAEKALEALDYYRSTDPNWHVSDETTYQELKTALAEAEEPLTEEEIRRLYRKAWTPESEADEVLAFARAIERAHGVGGDE